MKLLSVFVAFEASSLISKFSAAGRARNKCRECGDGGRGKSAVSDESEDELVLLSEDEADRNGRAGLDIASIHPHELTQVSTSKSTSRQLVGFDAARVGRDVLLPGIKPKLEVPCNLYEGKKIIVGRDKFGFVEGVLEKLRAFETLLQDYPEWIHNVVLIQLNPFTVTQVHQKDELYALLAVSVADLGVITAVSSRHDGMNTELVFVQERYARSPSVLSEFMGISKYAEDALQGTAKAIH
ncbi:hypothetical protein HGRIS_011470 [Hohenbuehelia grisea]|uniref:Uncharacterized protein n=1 Tax=Hohenbuehelia grisea TaxID=104357 RepID=A0ABR3JW90_9AGAR